MTHSPRKRRARHRLDPTDKCPYTFKVRYATMALAIETRDQLRAKGRRERSAYPCNRCGGWHLTSQRK